MDSLSSQSLSDLQSLLQSQSQLNCFLFEHKVIKNLYYYASEWSYMVNQLLQAMPQLKVNGERLLDFNVNATDKVDSWEVRFDPEKMEIEVGWKADKKEDDENWAKRSKRCKKPNRLLFDDYVDKYD